MRFEIDNYFQISTRSSFKLFAMFAQLGGFFYCVIILTQASIKFFINPIFVATLIERIYRKLPVEE